jgi:nucleoside-diphosphate-sugar epimerase
MPERLLVTGCTGYVAEGLPAALRRRNPATRIIGTALHPPAAAGAGFEEVLPADLRDGAAVRALIDRVRPDRVIHLASRRDGDLSALLATNAAGTDHLLAAMRDVVGRGARVLVVGSAAEIGHCTPAEMPLREECACRPLDPYGVSKLAQSAVAQAAFLVHGQDVVRVRLFNLVGPGTPASLLPGRCVELLLEAIREGGGGPLRFRSLDTRRDYTDIRDVHRALTLALDRGRSGSLYHIGSGEAVAGRRIVELLIAAARSRAGALAYEESVAGPPGVPLQVADARRAAADLGWRPEIGLERSAGDLWESAWSAASAA